MALRRTLPLMMRSTQVSKGPIRYDVGPHMEKWWSKHKHMDGMVERHISPMEQKTVEPYFWNWGGRMAKKFNENVFDIGPALIICVGTVYWSDWKFEQLSHAHRD